MLIGLVGCVKTKLGRPAPASELYTSALFRGRREAVEGRCDRWFVLSALHGLLEPDRVVEPYDLGMKDVPRETRRAWAASVVRDLEQALGSLGGHRFEIHAGADYTDHGLVDRLRRVGAKVALPLRGLTMGQQLAWYADTGSAPRSLPRSTGGQHSIRERHPGPTARGSGRYTPLRRHLVEQQDPFVTLTFAELERILGAPLPASARKHRPWWGNASSGHTQARAWLGAGYEVETVDLRTEWVRFVKVR